MNLHVARTRAVRFCLATGLALVGLLSVATAAEPGRPNILFVYADDLGLGDVSCYNADAAWKTPHLDRFAAEGMTFTDAHSASALCTPISMAALAPSGPASRTRTACRAT